MRTTCRRSIDALRHLVVSILILVVVISGTLNIYLLRQWRSTSKDLAGDSPASHPNDRRVPEGERPIDERFRQEDHRIRADPSGFRSGAGQVRPQARRGNQRSAGRPHLAARRAPKK